MNWRTPIDRARGSGRGAESVGVEPDVAGHPSAPPGIEVDLRPDSRVHDGRFANNAWLQELPKPLTKLTWDNAALMSPALAARLGVTDEDRVRLSLGGCSAVCGPDPPGSRCGR